MATRTLSPGVWTAPGTATSVASNTVVQGSNQYSTSTDTLSMPYSPISQQTINLTNGNNAVTIPAYTTFIQMILPVGNTNTVAIATSGYASAFSLNVAGINQLTVPGSSATTTLYLVTGGAISGCLFIFY